MERFRMGNNYMPNALCLACKNSWQQVNTDWLNQPLNDEITFSCLQISLRMRLGWPIFESLALHSVECSTLRITAEASWRPSNKVYSRKSIAVSFYWSASRSALCWSKFPPVMHMHSHAIYRSWLLKTTAVVWQMRRVMLMAPHKFFSAMQIPRSFFVITSMTGLNILWVDCVYTLVDIEWTRINKAI